MPTLLPGGAFAPVAPAQIEGLRREMVGTVRRLLGAR
jgi:hypothetical protein